MNQFVSPTRRNFLIGAGAAAMTVGMAGGAQTQSLTKLTQALGWIPNAEYAGLWVAMDKGYFAEEGIDMGYTPGGPNAPGVLVQLAAGEAEFAGGDWVPFYEALARDNDFVVIGCNYPTSPAAILSLSKAPVHKPQDLVGKTILHQFPTDRNTVNTVLTKAGLPLDYELISVGFSPEPLLAGEGDAFFCYATNQPITLELMGMERDKDFFVTLWSDLGYDLPGAPIIVPRAFLEENRPHVVGFLRALARGWLDNAADPKLGAELAVNTYGVDYGLDLKQQIRQSELGSPLVSAPGAPGPFWFDTALVDSAVLPVVEAVGVKGPLAGADKVVDLGPLNEALASL